MTSLLSLWPRLATKISTSWRSITYPFAGFGEGVSIHPTADISRSAAAHIEIGDEVYIAPDVWLNVVDTPDGVSKRISIGRGCKLGRRSTISAKNAISLAEDVLLGPSVLIMDHNHEYSNPTVPIYAQGTTSGGRISIEKNCWLGSGSVVLCGKGELTIGENSVIGASAVVTHSFPPFSVIAGNPAKLVKSYDTELAQWIRVS